MTEVPAYSASGILNGVQAPPGMISCDHFTVPFTAMRKPAPWESSDPSHAGESLQYSLRVCGQIQGIFNMRLPVLRRVGIQPLLLNAEYRAASRESAERRLGLPFASVLEHQARMIWSSG